MPLDQCPTCRSTLGFYDGPNGKPRCLNCFHDTDAPQAKEAPNPEPNAGGTTQAIAAAKIVGASDKAMRGPKETA